MTGELIHYDAMCHAIAAAYEVDEVKDIRDKALALEMYARQAGNIDAESQACKIRLRAERRCAQLIREREMARGTRGQLAGREASGGRVIRPPEDQPKTLAEMNISKDQSANWQKLANIPEAEFEAALAESERPTTNGIIAKFEQRPKSKTNEQSLWLWGRLLDFERDGLLKMSQSEMLAEMSPHMRETIIRLAPCVAAWLLEFVP
jgi:hypothetical protein